MLWIIYLWDEEQLWIHNEAEASVWKTFIFYSLETPYPGIKIQK